MERHLLDICEATYEVLARWQLNGYLNFGKATSPDCDDEFLRLRQQLENAIAAIDIEWLDAKEKNRES